MFKNKNLNGSNNISGQRISRLRQDRNLSQRALADEMQLLGLDIGKNTVQQIESGERFVTDLELAYFSHFFERSMEELIDFYSEYVDGTTGASKIAEVKKKY